MQTRSARSVAIALLVGATCLPPLPASAQTGTMASLAAKISGNDMVLTFPTATTGFYTVQTTPDLLQPWTTNFQLGVQGDGTTKTVTLANAALAGRGFYTIFVDPTPVRLVLPQSNAFAVLGHSCGGIQEQTYATGFDSATGYPTGDVYIQTRCGGSGRGGGYQVTTYSAWVSATWDFAGHLISSTPLAGGPTVDPSFTAADSYGDVVYNTGTAAFLIVPVPAAPTAVTAVQSGDQFQVSWTVNGANPSAVMSSTLTAQPVNSAAPILMSTVTGNASNGVISSLQPATTYQISVISTTVAGSSLASTPISVTTVAATIAPSAPTIATVYWQIPDPSGATDTLVAVWNAADPGNSPIDQYEVMISGSDGGGTFTQTVSGTTLTASFTIDYIPNWSITVRAHNAAGWGPWSAPPVTLGGL